MDEVRSFPFVSIFVSLLLQSRVLVEQAGVTATVAQEESRHVKRVELDKRAVASSLFRQLLPRLAEDPVRPSPAPAFVA